MSASAEAAPEGGPPPGPGVGSWLLYGAYGFTGRLLVEEAVGRGHRPVLAGRDPAKVAALAGEHGLEGRAFALADPGAVREGLGGVDAVFHAAGPFSVTGPPMLDACLAEGRHYLDITGEPRWLEAVLAADGDARDRGVALLPGAGMDVVPTDSVAAALAARLPGAVRLELALRSAGSMSPGTARTVLEHLPEGLLVRRGGRLVRARLQSPELRREVDFGPGVGVRRVIPYTWGDLVTAPWTTGIDDVTCYASAPLRTVRLLPVALPLLRALFSVGALRRLAQRLAGRRVTGPDEKSRRLGRTRVWGRVTAADGRFEEGVLETMEGYRFTAVAGVRLLEEILRRGPAGAESTFRGALTPARALGPDWVLGLPETRWLVGGAERELDSESSMT